MNFNQTKIKILELDVKGCVYLNHFSHRRLIAQCFKRLSRLGDGAFWLVMLSVVWISQGMAYTPQILYITVAGSIGTVIYKLLKNKTVRPRPYQVHQVILLGVRPLDHFSFPSGHTLHAVMATTLWGYIQPMLLLVMLPFTLLVALSRMVLGLHYPSDVLVGALIGAIVAILSICIAPMLSMVL